MKENRESEVATNSQQFVGCVAGSSSENANYPLLRTSVSGPDLGKIQSSRRVLAPSCRFPYQRRSKAEAEPEAIRARDYAMPPKLAANTIRLMPVRGVKITMKYHLQGLPGAIPYALLAEEVVRKLEDATRILKEKPGMEDGEILVLDAFRTLETQRHIFLSFKKTLATKHPGIDQESLRTLTKQFVSAPDGIFPHGTGGAVDVTLFVKGHEVNMGTGFDDFVPESGADWFRLHPPSTPDQEGAAYNREILREVMERAGFVGIPSEWWHYEFGTETWGESTGNPQILHTVLPPPIIEGAAIASSTIPLRQPFMQYGAGMVFNSNEDRAAALAHEKAGHYYARSSHPTTEGLANFIRAHVVPCEKISLCETGLSACLLTLKALAPLGGRILFDNKIYYEVQRSAMTIARDSGWELIHTDFTQPAVWRERLRQQYDKIDILYCDNPRNWWLDGIDIELIAEIAREHGSILVVDTSVQPLQDVLRRGADVGVFSLSKYPSLGLTMGGAITSNSVDLYGKINQSITNGGHTLCAEAATTIWSQIVRLDDHMHCVSQKTEKVAECLQDHGTVRHVRTPDKRLTGGIIGGQIAFHLKNITQAYMMERIVGQNSLNERSVFQLLCTFGSLNTTFEHFASNIRHRIGISREETNEVDIPPDMVRLGIGCDPAERIVEELEFLLNITDRANLGGISANRIYSKKNKK